LSGEVGSRCEAPVLVEEGIDLICHDGNLSSQPAVRYRGVHRSVRATGVACNAKPLIGLGHSHGTGFAFVKCNGYFVLNRARAQRT
jgi:hypothetical protein